MSMKVSGGSSKGKPGEVAGHVGGVHGKGGASTVGSVTQAGGASFTDVVEDMESRQLIAELEDLGVQMTRHPTGVMMSRYRELVGMVLDKVRGGMRVKRDFKWRRTERSMFVTIERTEGLLDELEEALARESDRMKMLSLMEEIKGCLISLLF